MSFCVGGEVDPFHPPVKTFLDFLLWEYRRGRSTGARYSYRTMNVIRSAVSAVALIDGKPAGQHPLACRFLKAVFNENPALPRYHTVWDPDVVLSYLKGLGQNEGLSLIQLSRKLTMLMLLTSGQRGQTIMVLDVRNLSFSGGCASFRIGDPLKNSRANFHLSQVTFYPFGVDIRLCVVETLSHYLKRTEGIRGVVTSLFITSRPPFQVASRDTIRRWTKDVMRAAGIDLSLFAPASTRASSSSNAALSVSLGLILRTGGWSSDSVFGKHYNKPLCNLDGFASAVLGTS